MSQVQPSSRSGGLSAAAVKSLLEGDVPSRTRSGPTRSVDDAAYIQRLEKHLNDVDHGEGYLSRGTGREINEQDLQNGSLLRPNALSDYGAYKSLLSYDQNARLVYSVNTTTQTVADIEAAPERAKAFTEAVKRAYGYA